MAASLSLGGCPWTLSISSLVLMGKRRGARRGVLGWSTGAYTGKSSVSLAPGVGPVHGVSDSVLVLQGCSESGHHHDGPSEEDLEQHPGHAVPAAEHKWPQEASLITGFADPHWAFLNTYPGKGAAGW